MKLNEFLKSENIKIGLEVHNKWDAIDEMVKILMESGNIEDISALKEAMLLRERTMSTGIGRGVAIPHASSDAVKELTVAAATLKEPIDFESLDMQPVQIIFSIASPKERGKSYMELLSQIAKLFQDKNFAQKLLGVKTADEFFKIVSDNLG